MTNWDESSLVSEVKQKEDQDTILLDLEASVYKKRVLAFEKWGDGVMKNHGRLCVPKVVDSKRGSRRRLIALDISFILVSPRCIVI